MKFECKISGTMVTDFDITPVFNSQFITLNDCIKILKSQDSMNFILDTFRFTLCEDGEWRAILDWDSIMKISVLENYPEYENKFHEYFGDNWLKHYIRFGH